MSAKNTDERTGVVQEPTVDIVAGDVSAPSGVDGGAEAEVATPQTSAKSPTSALDLPTSGEPDKPMIAPKSPERLDSPGSPRLAHAKHKKKKSLGKFWASCCGLALLLILAGLFFDFGGLGSGLGLPVLQTQIAGTGAADPEYEAEPPLQEESAPPETPAPDGEPSTATDTITATIRVVYDQVWFGDETVTLRQLQGIVLEHDSPGLVWFLEGERALLAAMEGVRALLRDAGVDYVEVVVP